jgi:hypothetical protein
MLTSNSSCRTCAFAVLCAVLAALASAGCGSDEPARVIVSGNVSFDGQPVQLGGIQFVPQEGTPGVAALFEISGGHYAAEAKGGLPVGNYKVEIRAFRAAANSSSPAPREQYIPAKYNTNSELTTTVEASSTPLARDFALTK